MEELVERVAPNALRVSVGDHLTLAFTGAPLLGEAELNFRKEGTLQFLSPQGLLAEETKRTVDHGVRQRLRLKGRGFYGLGQHPGTFNYADREVTLVQRNGEIALPVLVSDGGVGIVWDVYSLSRVKVGRPEGGFATVDFQAEDVDGFVYYVIYGPDPKRVVSTYWKLTGGVPLLPRWAFGYWQSKERYATQYELLEVVAEFRRRKIPIDVVVQDWMYWGKYGWNALKFDESTHPDPSLMTTEAHRMGVKVIVSVWSNFGVSTDVVKELRPHLVPGSLNYDPSSPEGRRAYWELVDQRILSRGFDGLWLDASEPEFFKPTGGDRGTYTFYTGLRDSVLKAGRGSRYVNAYPLLHTSGVYEGWKSKYSTRPVVLTRSAYLGQNRTGAIVWSGDIHHDWGVLKAQVQAGINFSFIYPYWTTDTGGFFSGDPADESYREIFLRWLAWSVFCPVMRVHGTSYPKEPWRFGKDEEIVKSLIELRYRFLPYIYTAAWEVTKGTPMMRPLAADFQDEEVLDVDDQYMFGPSLMVSPITFPGGRREVYIPRGKWYDFWTWEEVEGGKSVEVEVPLDRIPLHVRGGSVLPLGRPIEGADLEQDPLELRLYGEGSSSSELYEDEGDGLGYEKGEYQVVPITRSEGELRLSDAIGNLRREHTFRILVGGRVWTELRYVGREIRVEVQ
ncbi:glycoside hydrolase family 31 protein [Sulfodiicoccus acidiphilus]|uniref:glycoside hydrolase family 31 protein n=1 Tax=Sulfodiicoccus acidiphilus TaxID=1670455 RepID=UPI001668D6B3|nr:TIM-barrel domain-containing protein [Sulfodiicoccus acidiphilus]